MAGIYLPQQPTSGTSFSNQAATMFTGQPAPFLSQVLQPIPDPTVVKTQWENMFPNTTQSPTFYSQQAKDYLAQLPPTPVVTAPHVQPVQVQFPSGDADRLAQSLYNQQAGMAIRELERRQAQGTEALQANLAQTGLADSGVGVGQQAKLGREFDEQIGATSTAIAEGATAKALEAKLAVAQQQATIDLQANLANAQMDFGAQQVNARNILERGAFSAQAYVTALGLDAQYADRLRGDFISFLDAKTKAALGQSEVARGVLSDIFNAILQSQALDLKTKEYQLAQKAQGAQEQQFAQELALKQQELQNQSMLQSQQNQIAALGQAGQILGTGGPKGEGVYQSNAERGTIGASLASLGGANIPYQTQNAYGTPVFTAQSALGTNLGGQPRYASTLGSGIVQ